MDNLQIFALAVLQGLTEFLPISSSAHLVLLPQLLHWPDQGLVFDVAVHFGSLIAAVGSYCLARRAGGYPYRHLPGDLGPLRRPIV